MNYYKISDLMRRCDKIKKKKLEKCLDEQGATPANTAWSLRHY